MTPHPGNPKPYLLTPYLRRILSDLYLSPGNFVARYFTGQTLPDSPKENVWPQRKDLSPYICACVYGNVLQETFIKLGLRSQSLLMLTLVTATIMNNYYTAAAQIMFDILSAASASVSSTVRVHDYGCRLC